MKKKLKGIIALAMVGIMGFSVGMTSTSASNISDIEDEKEKEKEKMNEAQEVVDQLKNEQDNILQSIAMLDNKVAEFNQEIKNVQEKKAEIEANIVVVQAELEQAKLEVDAQYEAMKKRIQYSYMNGDISYVDTIFTSSDVSDIINQSEYVDHIYSYDSKMLDKLIETKKEVANKELVLQENLDTMAKYEEEIKANQAAVEAMIAGKKEQIGVYEDSIEDYEDLVAEYQANIDSLDAQIAEIEAALERERQRKAEEARQAALAAAAANGTTANDDIKYYYDSAPSVLQWPVTTGGTVTSEFGPRWGRNHNGMDIACSMYTPIVACEKGTVVKTGSDNSMGNYVMVDHGGGMTTIYMHNSEVVVSVGQEVARGQLVAYSGNTGFSTGPHCHIGVRVNGSYVNPRQYLTR